MCPSMRVVIAALLWLGFAGLTVQAAEPAAPSGDFPTFGLKLKPPADSVDELPSLSEQIAFYQLRGGNDGAAILIEIVPSNGKSTAEAAKALAESGHATAEPSDIVVNGEKAFKVSTPINVQQFTQRDSYVVVHDGWVYVFSGLSTEHAKAAAPLKAMLQSLKFSSAQPTNKYLKDFGKKPLIFFNRFSIAAPPIVRPDGSDEASMHLGIHDYSVRGHVGNPLNLDVQRIQTGDQRTFANLRDAYSDGIVKHLNMPEKPVWTDMKAVPGLHVSQPITVKGKSPDGEEMTMTHRFTILELGPGDFVQILFSFSDLPPADLAAYKEMSDRMLASIKILPNASAERKAP